LNDANISQVTCNDAGLVAELALPEGASKLPAIIVLGGSEGGIGTARTTATRLARQGYAALAVAYFREPGLPRKLIEIPLEYFSKAIQWLTHHPQVDPERVGLFGVSKGAEAALLVASRNPAIVAVVAIVPSDVVWEGLHWKFKTPVGSSWSENGKPLPHIPFDRTVKVSMRSVVDMYRRSRHGPNATPEAAIPIERINGPILLVSGEDDRLWPSSEMSEALISRLSSKGFPHSKVHIRFPGAGHAISPLFRWQDRLVARTFGKLAGGTNDNNRIASEETWRQTLRFFDTNLRH
jgi:uncharacterized protein